MVAGHGERGLELRVDALLPRRVVVPDRAPGDAGGKARLHRSAARRVIAAEADGDDADLLRHRRRRASPGNRCRRCRPSRSRGAGTSPRKRIASPVPGPSMTRHRDAALDQVRHAAHVLDLLGDVEAVEEHDAGRARRCRVLRMHEIAGQAAAFERHLDDLDLDVGERRRTGGSNRPRCDRRRAPSCPSACGSARPSGSSCRRAGRTPRRRPDGPRPGSARRGRAPRRRPSRRRRTRPRRPRRACPSSRRPILCSSLMSAPP